MKYIKKILDRGLITTSIFFASLFSTSVFSNPCSNFKVGVQNLTKSKGGINYISTASVKAQDSLDNSLDLALAEAKISAKAALLKINRIPKSESGELIGVVEESDCIDGLNVYATIRLTDDTYKTSKILRDAMDKSFRDNPTPQSR